MNQPAFMPIRNTALPRGFHYIRIEREADLEHPEDESHTAYILIVPLDAEARIDAELYRKCKEACRFVRRRHDSKDLLGHLIPSPGGRWRFHYDLTGNLPGDAYTHFGDECFQAGAQVSFQESDDLNVYRVVSVMPLWAAS